MTDTRVSVGMVVRRVEETKYGPVTQWLRVEGKFQYPRWVFSSDRAEIFTRARAYQWEASLQLPGSTVEAIKATRAAAEVAIASEPAPFPIHPPEEASPVTERDGPGLSSRYPPYPRY